MKRLQTLRVRHITGAEIPLRSYAALHGDRAVNDVLLKRVLYGISCRNYEAARRSDSRRDRAVGVNGVGVWASKDREDLDRGIEALPEWVGSRHVPA